MASDINQPERVKEISKSEMIIHEAFYKMIGFEAELNLIMKTIDELRLEMRSFRDDWLEHEVINSPQEKAEPLAMDSSDNEDIKDLINKDYGK